MKQHWAQQYIGKPWVVGGRGPDEFDCFGLLVWIYKHHYGLDLPKYMHVHSRDLKRIMVAFSSAPELVDWVQVQHPTDGCAVGLSHNQLFHHVGIYLDVDGGIVLHAMDGKSVLAQTVARLRLEGWRRIEFFKHKSWLTS